MARSVVALRYSALSFLALPTSAAAQVWLSVDLPLRTFSVHRHRLFICKPKPLAKPKVYAGPIRACYRQISQNGLKYFSSASLALPPLKQSYPFCGRFPPGGSSLFVSLFRLTLEAKAFYAILSPALLVVFKFKKNGFFIRRNRSW